MLLLIESAHLNIGAESMVFLIVSLIKSIYLNIGPESMEFMIVSLIKGTCLNIGPESMEFLIVPLKDFLTDKATSTQVSTAYGSLCAHMFLSLNHLK